MLEIEDFIAKIGRSGVEYEKEYEKYKFFRKYSNKVAGEKIVYYPCMGSDVRSIFNAVNFDKLYAVSYVDYPYDDIVYSKYFVGVTGKQKKEFLNFGKNHLVFNEVTKILKKLKYMGSKKIKLYLSPKNFEEFIKALNEILEKNEVVFYNYAMICFDQVDLVESEVLEYNNIIFKFNLKNKPREIVYYFDRDVFEFDNSKISDANIFFLQVSPFTFDNTEYSVSTLIDRMENVKLSICNYIPGQEETIEEKYNLIAKYEKFAFGMYFCVLSQK